MVKLQNVSQVDLQVVAQELDGTPKTDISTAFVRVYHIVSGVETDVLASTPLVQVGTSNTFRYTWVTTMAVGTYFAEYSLTDVFSRQNITVEDVDILDLAIKADIDTIRIMESGRWRILNNQMVFYAEDGSTPFMTFDLYDEHGLPSSIDVSERRRV